MTDPQRTAKQNVHGALPSCRIECGCGHADSCDARSSSPPLLHHPLPPQGAPAGRKSKLKAYVRANHVIVRHFQQNHQHTRGPAISPCQKSRLRLDHETADFIPSPPPSSRALLVWFCLTALSSVVVRSSCCTPLGTIATTKPAFASI